MSCTIIWFEQPIASASDDSRGDKNHNVTYDGEMGWSQYLHKTFYLASNNKTAVRLIISMILASLHAFITYHNPNPLRFECKLQRWRTKQSRGIQLTANSVYCFNCLRADLVTLPSHILHIVVPCHCKDNTAWIVNSLFNLETCPLPTKETRISSASVRVYKGTGVKRLRHSSAMGPINIRQDATDRSSSFFFLNALNRLWCDSQI